MRGETCNQLMTLGSLVSCRRPTLGDQAVLSFRLLQNRFPAGKAANRKVSPLEQTLFHVLRKFTFTILPQGYFMDLKLNTGAFEAKIPFVFNSWGGTKASQECGQIMLVPPRKWGSFCSPAVNLDLPVVVK